MGHQNHFIDLQELDFIEQARVCLLCLKWEILHRRSECHYHREWKTLESLEVQVVQPLLVMIFASENCY